MAEGPGWFWTQAEWAEWSDTLARLVPEEFHDDIAQEAVIEKALRNLARWKAEALPVLEGLQELGRALDLPLGERTTGPAALAAVSVLKADRDRLQRALAAEEDRRKEFQRRYDKAREDRRNRDEAIARVRAVAERYEADARDEGYGGELWSTTATAIFTALNGPASQPKCDICSDTGRMVWMLESDPHRYQEIDEDWTVPCPDCAPPTTDAEEANDA